MPADTFDVLLQGNPFCDLTFTFADREALPGLGQEVFAGDFAMNPGGVFNISAVLTGLGSRVGLMAPLGDDIFSRYIAERMEAIGLSRMLVTWLDRPLPVITVGISFPHDRLYISYAAAAVEEGRRLTVDDLDRYRPRAVFSYAELGIEFYRETHRRGILSYADASWDLEYLHSDLLLSALPHVDIFSPNLPEALEITGATGGQEALDILSERCRCVVIKMGSQGCMAKGDGRRYEVPPIPVQAIDTTGAGDNFNAGLIYGLLAGYDFETCLRCANIVGGLSTLALGGSNTGITPEVVERWLVDFPSPPGT